MSTSLNPSQSTNRPDSPIRPSPFVRNVMGPMTKVLNPLIGRLAGRRRFRTAAQLRHTGRRSGREYVTPVGARVVGDVVVIPLTFGNQSDWAKNVRAAGGCSIRFAGRDYRATNPEFLGVDEDAALLKAAFSGIERRSFRLLGIRQVLRLHVAPAAQSALPGGQQPGIG